MAETGKREGLGERLVVGLFVRAPSTFIDDDATSF